MAGIFEQDVITADSLGSIDEKLKFLKERKKEVGMQYDGPISELQKQKIDEKRFEQLMNAPREGQPVVGSADPLDAAFENNGQQPLTGQA